MGRMIPNPPKIFNVNWFRLDDEGKFIWPGFGDNLRVLLWILDRCNDRVDAVKTPIGYLPRPEDIDLEGTDVDLDTLKSILDVNKEDWIEELNSQEEHLAKFDKLPVEVRNQFEAQKERIYNM